MQHTTLRRWLRFVIIGMGICGLFVYGWVFPTISSKLCQMYPEYTSQYHIWLVFLLITAIPCYGVLLFAWRIANNIGKGDAFTYSNGKAKAVRISTLIKLCDALDCQPGDLLEYRSYEGR